MLGSTAEDLNVFQTHGHLHPCLSTRRPQGRFIETSHQFIKNASYLLLQAFSHIAQFSVTKSVTDDDTTFV
jgi:hypothetical protein